MENYFNYFTEIEEHFQKRRGTVLLLSPLDWALMETWKDAGIPLEAVLRGIDTTFEKWERRPRHTRKVNALAFCAQEVLATAEELKEAAVGRGNESAAKAAPGLEPTAVANFLRQNADQLEKLPLPEVAQQVALETVRSLRTAADALSEAGKATVRMEDLERRMGVAEEKLHAALLTCTPDDVLLKVRTEVDRDLVPYRSKMNVTQIERLHKQYLYKRLLEKYGIPRLSLFYM